MNSNSSALAKNLQYFRAQSYLNKKQMAEIVGTSATQISHLENNEIAAPNYFLLKALADYFGVEIVDFVEKDLTNDDDPLLRLLNRARIFRNHESVKHIVKALDTPFFELGRAGVFNSDNRKIKPNK